MAKKSNSVPSPGYPTETDWRAEDDMRTLLRAEEIKRDKKRYAAAKRCAKEKLAEMDAAFRSTK